LAGKGEKSMTAKKTNEAKTPANTAPKVSTIVKPKRGHYQQKECPYCHSMVGNLGNHVKLKHPGNDPNPPAPAKPTMEEMLGKETPKPEKPAEIKKAEAFYFCTTCANEGEKAARVRSGEETCWRCGAVLNWEGL
jgi:hypothetical protein